MPIITQVPVAITLHSSARVSALPLLDKVQQLRYGPNEGQQPVVWLGLSPLVGCRVLTVQLHLSSIILLRAVHSERSFLRFVTLLLLILRLALHSILTDTVPTFQQFGYISIRVLAHV